jgi:hypothetical protein
LNSLEDNYAGKWLEVLPKTASFTFNNPRFQAAYRLYTRQPVVAPGSRCDCRRHIPLDMRGHHIMTGCAKGPARISTHDAVKIEINNFFRVNGFRTRLEEMDVFNEVPNIEHDIRLRPDISVLEGNLFPVKTILDIAITCPTSQHQNRLGERVKGAAAALMFSSKIRKYKALADMNGLSFLPLIFESSGHIHEEAVKVFLKVAEQYRKVGQMFIFNYFIARLSCVLQKSLASALLENHLRINGNATQVRGYSFSEISEFADIHA